VRGGHCLWLGVNDTGSFLSLYLLNKLGLKMSNVNVIDLLDIDGVTPLRWSIQWLSSRCGVPCERLPEGISRESVSLLSERMALDVGVTFLANKEGVSGILFDAEVLTIESDGDNADNEDVNDGALKSRAQVDAIIMAELIRIKEKFPSLLVGLVTGDNHWGGRAGALGFLPGDTELTNEEIELIANCFCDMGG
jgi:hypothetical protein